MTVSKIAIGYGATPVAWHLLSPPMFRHLEFGVKDEWDVPTRLAGDLSAAALPATLYWTLAAITPAERLWLHTNILTGASTQVTIVTPDYRRADIADRKFNAIAYRQPLERDNGSPRFGAWPDYTITFRKLTDIGAG